MFPAGIIDPTDLHNYKNIIYEDIRFDRILLSMVDQAGRTWNLKTEKFLLHGFSGGGQFAHRFLYLHPDHLIGVSIGAPGRLTPPDSSKAWPHGLSNVCEVFDLASEPDWTRIKDVPVQLVVGLDDTKTSMLEVMKNPNSAEVEAGPTRLGRVRWLSAAFVKLGLSVTLTEVPGVSHDAMKCIPAVESWLSTVIDVDGTQH